MIGQNYATTMLGDDSVTLEYLSTLKNSPAFATLRNRSARESWSEERDMYRYNVATKKLQKATLKDASISSTQLQDAKLLRARAYASLKQRKDIVLDDREIRFYLQSAAELERKAMGLDHLYNKQDDAEHFDKMIDAIRSVANPYNDG